MLKDTSRLIVATGVSFGTDKYDQPIALFPNEWTLRYFVEKNPDKAKASMAKAMRTKDEEALQSAYNTYAREILDRTMVVPGKAVAEAVDLARESGTPIRRKPEELYDNSFVFNLEKSGFLKEIWGSENYKR